MFLQSTCSGKSTWLHYCQILVVPVRYCSTILRCLSQPEQNQNCCWTRSFSLWGKLPQSKLARWPRTWGCFPEQSDLERAVGMSEVFQEDISVLFCNGPFRVWYPLATPRQAYKVCFQMLEGAVHRAFLEKLCRNRISAVHAPAEMRGSKTCANK